MKSFSTFPPSFFFLSRTNRTVHTYDIQIIIYFVSHQRERRQRTWNKHLEVRLGTFRFFQKQLKLRKWGQFFTGNQRSNCRVEGRVNLRRKTAEREMKLLDHISHLKNATSFRIQHPSLKAPITQPKRYTNSEQQHTDRIAHTSVLFRGEAFAHAKRCSYTFPSNLPSTEFSWRSEKSKASTNAIRSGRSTCKHCSRAVWQSGRRSAERHPVWNIRQSLMWNAKRSKGHLMKSLSLQQASLIVY